MSGQIHFDQTFWLAIQKKIIIRSVIYSYSGTCVLHPCTCTKASSVVSQIKQAYTCPQELYLVFDTHNNHPKSSMNTIQILVAHLRPHQTTGQHEMPQGPELAPLSLFLPPYCFWWSSWDTDQQVSLKNKCTAIIMSILARCHRFIITDLYAYLI